MLCSLDVIRNFRKHGQIVTVNAEHDMWMRTNYVWYEIEDIGVEYMNFHCPSHAMLNAFRQTYYSDV